MFGALTVTVLNRGWDGSTKDRHNNPVVSVLDSYDLEGCNLQQQATDETLEARESTDTLWVLFAPPVPTGKNLGHIDRFQIDAAAAFVDPDDGETFATFELDGHPDQLGHIDGSAHHLELILRRVNL